MKWWFCEIQPIQGYVMSEHIFIENNYYEQLTSSAWIEKDEVHEGPTLHSPAQASREAGRQAKYHLTYIVREAQYYQINKMTKNKDKM